MVEISGQQVFIASASSIHGFTGKNSSEVPFVLNNKICGALGGHHFNIDFQTLPHHITFSTSIATKGPHGGLDHGVYKGLDRSRCPRTRQPFLISRELIAKRYNAERQLVFHLHQSMGARFLLLHHRIPSHVSQEAPCSSSPSWSERFTYSRKCTGFASREPMVDLLAVGEEV